jgi:hypothetical protein
MSVCYEIVCHKCKKRLWIGQGSVIYSAPPYMDHLAAFMHDHINHPLEFMRDETASETDYERIDWEE